MSKPNITENSRNRRIGRAITALCRWIRTLPQGVFAKKPHAIKDTANNVSSLHAKLAKHLSQTKVVSFDIFDTILERDIDPPDEVKQIVARKLCRTLLDEYDVQYTVEKLLQLRKEIEHMLRKDGLTNGKDFECKFSDIAQHLAARLSSDKANILAKRIIDHELETENEVLYVKRDMSIILAWLNDKGTRVIAISDMYLDHDHLHEIFTRKGLTTHIDQIYVSSESGICKHSGRLFEHVLQQEELKPHELLHIGDNHHSDYRSPAKMGIHTIHFNDKTSNRRRQTLRTYRHLAAKNAYWRGRYLLQIIRPAESQGFYYDYGYSILGPIYATFILGIIEAIKKNNIQHVYFLAREGELFLKLFRLILPDFFEPDQIPKTDYLYVSRRSISPASAHKGLTYEAAIAPLFNPKHQGLYSICRAYGLPPEQFNGIAEKYGYTDINEPICDWKSSRFKEMIQDTDFQHTVQQHTREHHDLLYRYLDQHGFFGQEKVAVVDIGWNGSIQKFLEDAFGDLENYPHVFGLYLGFIGGIQHRRHDDDKNTIVGILCDERGKPRPEDVFSRFEEIFEEGARALHPTTIGYQKAMNSDKIEPVFKADSSQDRAVELRANAHIVQFQEGIIDFASEFTRAIDLTGYSFEDIKPFTLTIAERAIVFPTAEEIEKLMQLGHAEDFGSSNIMDFRHEKLDGWLTLFRPRRLIKKLATANWKYGTARSLGIPGLNMIIRFYDLMKSK
ncbi:MAG: HAD hydrolase-like protein [Burkholderiales bacterium]|nr:HAD hydrolase-like protein [Burkholderiales bacterium]